MFSVAWQLSVFKGWGMTRVVRVMIVLIGIPRITRMFLMKEEKPTRNIPVLWTCRQPKPASELLCTDNSSKSSCFCQGRVSGYFSFPAFLKCTWSYQCVDWNNNFNWLKNYLENKALELACLETYQHHVHSKGHVSHKIPQHFTKEV